MNPLLLLGALGIGAYLLMTQSSSGASGSYAPPSPYGGGGGGGGPSPAPSDTGGYGGPTTLGTGGSSTPVGPAAVASSDGGYGGPASAPAPTYMVDETTARFPNLATGAGQGMSSYGGMSEDGSGGFPTAIATGTAEGPMLRWDPMSRRWY